MKINVRIRTMFTKPRFPQRQLNLWGTERWDGKFDWPNPIRLAMPSDMIRANFLAWDRVNE